MSEELTNTLPAYDARVLYVGRVDRWSPGGPRVQWPATEIRLRFRGTALQATLSDTGLNRYMVTIDNGTPTPLGSSDTRTTLDLARDLPWGEHTVSLVRCSGAGGGIVQFHQFAIDADGEWLAPLPRSHRIEFIGDSITAGTGDEGHVASDRITMHNTNAFLAYGSVAARWLDADCVCLAIRNRRLAGYGVRDNRPHKIPGQTLPEMYDRTLPGEPNGKWDFAQQPLADAVVINLSTNDFFTTGFDENAFLAAYDAFLHRVREHNPSAAIYLTDSPLLDDQSHERKDLTTLHQLLDRIAADQRTAGERNLRVFHFSAMQKADGIGAGWHPTVASHAKMAEKLVGTIKNDLGW